MVVRTIFALFFVAGFAALAFFFGRLPKPMPALVPQRAGFFVLIFGLALGHAPWSFRVGVTCANLVAVGIAWYLGARERKRDGFASFAHPALPEGHKPTFNDRARRLFTPMRWMFGLVAIFTWFLLFMGDERGPSERRAREQAGCVEGHDVSR